MIYKALIRLIRSLIKGFNQKEPALDLEWAKEVGQKRECEKRRVRRVEQRKEKGGSKWGCNEQGAAGNREEDAHRERDAKGIES